MEEDTWNATPPPPPTAPAGIPASKEAEVRRVVDERNNDSCCTLGSDTMNAMGAADVALARSVAKAGGASEGSVADHHASDAVSSVAEGSLMEQSLREEVTLIEHACGVSGRDVMEQGRAMLATSSCAEVLQDLKDSAASGTGIESYLLHGVDAAVDAVDKGIETYLLPVAGDGSRKSADDTVDGDVTEPQLSPSTEAFLATEQNIGGEHRKMSEPNWASQTLPEEVNIIRSVEKKPFLRKGSRKEPSSLHRMQQQSGAVERKSSEAKKLEYLEKMQQDQIEKLERRMARRDKALREQRKRKQQSVQKRRHDQTNRESDPGEDGEVPQQSPHELASPAREKGGDIGDAVNNDGCDDSPPRELHVVGDAVKEEAPPSSVGPSGRPSVPNNRRKMEPPNESTGMQRRRVPLKPVNKLASSEEDENAARKQCNDEQWQMLKSMRRRQEAALKEAERERETVRAWAITERESVQKWADDQRALIQRERHRASNAAMTTQREKQREEKKQRAAAADDQKKSKAEIDALRATIQKFRVEMDAAKARYKANEKRLKDKVREQNATIRLLEEKVESLEGISPKTSTEKSDAVDVTTPPATNGKATKKKKALTARSGDQKPPKQHGSSQSRGRKASLKDASADSEEKSPKRLETDECAVADETKEMGSNSAVVCSSPQSANATDKENGSSTSVAERSGSNDVDVQKRKDMMHALMEEPTERWLERLQQRQKSSTTNAPPPEGNDALPLNFPDNCGPLARANEVVESCCDPKSTEELHYLHDRKPYNPNDYIGASTSMETYNNGNGPSIPSSHGNSVHLNSAGRTRVEHTCPDGRRVIYRNGTRKETSADGTTKIYFVNGDVKTTYADQSAVVYYYAGARTTHICDGEGLEIFEFPNKQTEKHFPNGKKEIFFPDGTVKVINPNGSSEVQFADGVRIMETPDGTKQIIRY